MFRFYTRLKRCEIENIVNLAQKNYPFHSRLYVVVKDDTIKVCLQSLFFRNSFRRAFYGKLNADEKGTIIEGEFKLQPLIKRFMYFWFGGLGVFFVIMLLLYIYDFLMGSDNFQDPIGIFIPPLMGGFGLLLLFIGRCISKYYEERMFKYIQEELKAYII